MLEKLKQIPKQVSEAPKTVGSKVWQGAGGSIARGFVHGKLQKFLRRKLNHVRKDQLFLLLSEGGFLADMIDGDHPLVKEGLSLLETFFSREEIIELMNKHITPQMVAQVIQAEAPEFHKKIMEKSGEKWYYSQTKYLKQKFERILKEDW